MLPLWWKSHISLDCRSVIITFCVLGTDFTLLFAFKGKSDSAIKSVQLNNIDFSMIITQYFPLSIFLISGQERISLLNMAQYLYLKSERFKCTCILLSQRVGI